MKQQDSMFMEEPRGQDLAKVIAQNVMAFSNLDLEMKH